MSIIDYFTNIGVKHKEEKKFFALLLAVATYTDQVIRETEKKQAIEFMNIAFGEDIDFMLDEYNKTLESFSKDVEFFEKQKEFVFNFIQKNCRRDLVEVMEKIFTSDHQIAKNEQKFLDALRAILN